MLRRRIWLAGAGLLALARAGWSAEPLEVLSADVRPLSIPDGLRRGIVLDIVRDALQAVGYEVRFRFLPFAEALQETQARSGTLMAPLARTSQREQGFAWIAKVVDVPQAMGSLRDKPAVDLDGARRLARIGVVKGGVQENFLKEKGFANLVPFASAREIAQALDAGQVEAWYATATEIVLQFEAIGRPGAVTIGPAIQTVPVWLAGNTDTASLPVDAIRTSIAQMEHSGAIDRIFKSYVVT